MWMPSGEIVPDSQRQGISFPKLMLTVIGNPSGFHILKSLPKESKFNTQFYANNILVAIFDWR
jgi:hypothetical protein